MLCNLTRWEGGDRELSDAVCACVSERVPSFIFLTGQWISWQVSLPLPEQCLYCWSLSCPSHLSARKENQCMGGRVTEQRTDHDLCLNFHSSHRLLDKVIVSWCIWLNRHRQASSFISIDFIKQSWALSWFACSFCSEETVCEGKRKSRFEITGMAPFSFLFFFLRR